MMSEREEMMSERGIRIRIWDKQEKKMIYPDTLGSSKDYDSLYLNRKGKVIVFDDSDGGKDGLHEHLNCWISSDRFIPLLFTGLPDKNGKEGCHKDISLDKEINAQYQIEWRDGGFYLKGIGKDVFDMTPDDLEIIALKGQEIIGNPYENPNLLRKEREKKAPPDQRRSGAKGE